MIKKVSLLILILFSTSVFAQYHVEQCKSKSFVGEFCLVKEFQSVAEFSSSDLMSIRSYAIKHPELDWMKVMDSTNSLVKDLSGAGSTIRASDKARYNRLLAAIKIKLKPEDVLEATALYLVSNPAESFYLSNKDKSMMEKIAGVLSAPSVANSKHCTPNPAKYEAIMNDRSRCSDLDDSMNSFSFYTALAEIAACDNYNVDQIGVTETTRTRGLSLEAPCKIKLNGDISPSIGAGTVNVKSNGEVYKLDWAAGHDLTGKKNDLNFWRDQLEPQMQNALAKKPAKVEVKKDGVDKQR